MARATRIALDLALVSLRNIGPFISKVWYTTKSLVEKTPAKPIVCNTIVMKTETLIDTTSDKLMTKIVDLRNYFLPKELKYLEKEVEKVRTKIETVSKSMKPALGIAWQYAKTEVAPPMTLNYLHGLKGRQLEESASKAANNFINGLEHRVREMHDDANRGIGKNKEEISVAQEKMKATAEAQKKQAQKKAEELKKKLLDAEKKAKEVEVKVADKTKEVKSEFDVETKKKEAHKKVEEIKKQLLQAINEAKKVGVIVNEKTKEMKPKYGANINQKKAQKKVEEIKNKLIQAERNLREAGARVVEKTTESKPKK